MKWPGKTIYHGCRLILAAVFIYAGAAKAHDMVGFAGQVAHYQLLPYAWNYLIAAILPYLELLCGILLLLNRRVRPAVLTLFILNLIFIAALSSALLRGLDIDCGCFRPDAASPTGPGLALLRDLGLLVLLLATWALRCVQRPLEAE